MRTVAVLCDIHGNLPALDAVLEELRAAPPDAVVLGGDVVAGPQPAEVLAGVDAGLVVGGHAHRQFDLCAGGRRVVNAGSVGRPYEREPGAYWLWLGPGVELRRSAYDTRAAVEAFRALGYPDADGMVAGVDPDEVAARFEAGADAPLAPESLTGA